MGDSNSRPDGPKPPALPTALIPDFWVFSFFHDTTANGKNKDFSVCGHSCGQSCFCAVFGNRRKTRYRPCRKALRRFASPYPGYRHGTPKAGALPTALHPVIELFIRLGVFSQTRRDNSFATPGDLRAASGRTLPAYCTVLSSAAQGGNETFSARDHPQARDVRSGRDGRILRIAPSCQVSCAENADRGDRPFPQGLAQAAFSVSWRQTFTPAMAKAKTNQKMHMTRG